MVDELRIPVSGGELAVRDYGGPGRTVVLVHSVGYSSDVWRRFAPLLAQSHRVLAVDLRGHGQTTAQVDVVDDVVADFERLVAVLELRCPVIVGHQYGGGVAAAVAAAYPLLWGGLCLIDSPAIGPREDYLGLMQIFASESMLDELVARFALGAEGHGPEALEAFLESRGVPMATDWLSVPRVGGNDYSLLRAILRDGSGGWVRQPTRQTVLRLTEIADFPTPRAVSCSSASWRRCGRCSPPRANTARASSTSPSSRGLGSVGWPGVCAAVRSSRTPTRSCCATPWSPCSRGSRIRVSRCAPWISWAPRPGRRNNVRTNR